MSRKVAVTGANGYIASQIVHDLLKAGYTVVGTVRNPSDPKHDFLKHGLTEEQAARLTLVSIPDISRDEGFREAFEGCDVVVAAAQPMIMQTDDPENQVIKPAVNGANYSLNAAFNAGAKKYIFISSMAAVSGSQRKNNPNHTLVETDWNDEMGTAYSKAKTLAERAVWDFAKEHPTMEVVSVNPTMVVGPQLENKEPSSSLNLVVGLLKGAFNESGVGPMVFGLVDVRDVSELTLKAIESNHVNGRRYLLSTRRNFGILDVARLIEESFPGRFQLPNKVKDNQVVTTTENGIDNGPSVELLGRELRDPKDSLKDTIEGFIAAGSI